MVQYVQVEACAAYEDDVASRPHGKSKATEEDEDYMEEEDDDDDDGGDNGDQDDDDYEYEQSVLQAAYPFWHLLTKGECQAFIYLVIGQLVIQFRDKT